MSGMVRVFDEPGPGRPGGLHIVQLANFYGPRSGGLRTALHHLGAGYVASGHRVTLVVPGVRLPSSR